MTSRRLSIRDIQASVIAATATLVTILLNGSTPIPTPSAVAEPRPAALDSLISAESAEAEAAWLLDQPDAAGRLSFAPDYDRLVWQVDTAEGDVIVDAKTGEALEFRFD